MGSYAEITRAIIATTPEGLHMGPKPEQTAWHRLAAEVFVGNTALTSADFLAFGTTLLRTASYDDIRAQLEAGVAKEQPLQQLRSTREVLVVGRNVINLANTTDMLDDSRSRPLTTLITDLGNLADANGHGLLIRRRIIRRDFEPAKQAAAYIQGDFQAPVDRQTLLQRAADSLQTDKLVRAESKNNLWPAWAHDEQDYLRKRRLFRAVVDLGIASMALEPSAEKLEYVHQGLALNQHYRAQHASMEKLQAYV